MRRSNYLLIIGAFLFSVISYGQNNNLNDAKRQYGLADNYYRGVKGYAKDLKMAYLLYLQAANSGYVTAYNQVGYMLELGEGTQKDPNAAFEWYLKSAKAGDRNGQYSLAWCYQHGIGVMQNYKQALQWYRESAAQGYVDAYNKVGYLLENGLGELNPSEAFRYYKQSAERGDDIGMYCLGICYVNGTGTDCSDEKAKEWLTKSANKGNRNAKQRLREMSMPDFNQPPMVSFIGFSDKVSDSSFTLDVGVKANNGKVTKTAVYLNGSKLSDTRGLNVVKDDGYQLRWKNSLKLVEGKNTIKVEVTNRAGRGIKEGIVTYLSNKKASIEWLSHESSTNTESFPIKVNINSESRIESVVLTLNGQQISLGNDFSKDSKYLSLNRTVSLVEGNNSIKLTVSNMAGTSVNEHYVNYVKPQKRLALLIGNSNYLDPDKSLRNPLNDATDLSEKLKSLGFDVLLRTDADRELMDNSIIEFGEKSKEYDVALFYYAGHGIQQNGINYLIPVTAKLEKESRIKYECVNANEVLDEMELSHCRTKIVILDACRNNPFERSWHRGVDSNKKGLSLMGAPSGTFIAYATGAGKVAQDGEGRNSPFTSAMLKMLDEPNLSLQDFFMHVGIEVERITHEEQTPWITSSLKGYFYFNKK